MAQKIVYMGRRTSKAEIVAAVTNQLLFELIERTRRSEGVRDYYDISVIGYSGDGVYPLLTSSRDMISVKELASLKTQMRPITIERQLPNGEFSMQTVCTNMWVEPKATGQTPMYEALMHVKELVSEWSLKEEHTQSFPPVVFNITDGESSDSNEDDIREISERIKSISPDDGDVFLINTHIASDPEAKSIIFPTESEITNANRYARLLFDSSSRMPEIFDDAIRNLRGGSVTPPFRGMSYNASISDLISVINIGSMSTKFR